MSVRQRLCSRWTLRAVLPVSLQSRRQRPGFSLVLVRVSLRKRGQCLNVLSHRGESVCNSCLPEQVSGQAWPHGDKPKIWSLVVGFAGLLLRCRWGCSRPFNLFINDQGKGANGEVAKCAADTELLKIVTSRAGCEESQRAPTKLVTGQHNGR